MDWELLPTRPQFDGLTQGVVFTCAVAEEYPGCVRGLAITARCDVSQDKASIYTYLPVIPLKRWWRLDGARALLSRAAATHRGDVVCWLRERNLARSLLDLHTLRSIAGAHIDMESEKQKSRQRIERLILEEELLKRCDIMPITGTMLSEVTEQWPKLREQLQAELVSQRLGGYYFLPAIEHKGDSCGYVVLLREVRHLPREVAKLISQGLQKPVGDDVEAALCHRYLDFGSDDFAFPIGLIPSPLIEHIMQCFAQLFSRIGLDDIPVDYLATLWPSDALTD